MTVLFTQLCNRQLAHARPRAGRQIAATISKRDRRSITSCQRHISPGENRQQSSVSSAKFAVRYHRTKVYSITALTDSSGTIKERYAYDAYGNLSIFDGSGTTRTATAEGNRYTSTARERDADLSLYHYRARMYDPIAGRFLSRDPIGFNGSKWVLYEYVSSRSMLHVDPLGMIKIKPNPGHADSPPKIKLKCK